MIESMLIAGVGGFVGTCGRYLTGVAAKKIFGTGFPYGTFCVNVVGCFIIGIFFGLWGVHELDTTMKVFLMTGFCGGFTTFSSFSHDSYKLIEERQWGKFSLYMIGTVVLGLLMVWLGMKCV